MQAGQAWARLGEFEAAGAALAKGAAQAQAATAAAGGGRQVGHWQGAAATLAH